MDRLHRTHFILDHEADCPEILDLIVEERREMQKNGL